MDKRSREVLNINTILTIPIFIQLLVIVGFLVILLFISSFAADISDSTIARIVKNTSKILLCIAILAVVIKIFVPNYTTEATVEAVGGKGLTVSFVKSYGEISSPIRINVDSVLEYNVGDIITIDVYDFWIKEAGRC